MNEALGFVSPKRSPRFCADVGSGSRFEKPARLTRKKPRLRRPCSRKARGAPGISIPSPMRGSSRTNVRERSAERRWCGTPHPVARPYDRAGPSSGRELPVHDADRRSTAAFSFSLETAFWKRTGAAIRNALDSAGFHPRSSARTSRLNRRTHVLGPGSVSRDPRRSGCVDRTRRRRIRSII